ncbi:metal ABC transporter solute-binding protein, Zn/Mn family [Myxosarcina sp. GI1]|uniref:metal ABC transporter solute-binding protein, Zn/Mn family n=1 Tax=Myxosarcina sp. GI1 TaxID=1541065 RepID=UPI00056127B1|nr:metal ABC transporter substrate-binding protein [Myxosarcina sp. GI1]
MLERVRGKQSLLGVAVLAMTSLTGCNFVRDRSSVLAQTKPTVVATHSIICDFVEAIAEDTLDLTCLLKGTQDPHTYRPTPRDRQLLEAAQLILYGGYELEPRISELLAATQTPTPKIAVYEAAVTEPIVGDHHHEAEHDEAEAENENTSETQTTESSITDRLVPEANQLPDTQAAPETQNLEGADPHVWQNVENAVATVESLQTALTQLNPANAALYLQNSVALEDRLWLLDAWIKNQVATIPEAQKILVTVHDSFNYYVKAYEFTDYLSLQGLSDEESPTASQLRELATQVRQQEIPTIFAESTASDRVINSVAREAGVELAQTKLSADGLGEADTYIEMMVDNTCTIVDGLGGNCTPFEN